MLAFCNPTLKKEGAGIQGTRSWDSVAQAHGGPCKEDRCSAVNSNGVCIQHPILYPISLPILRTWCKLRYRIHQSRPLKSKFCNFDIGDLGYWTSISKFHLESCTPGQDPATSYVSACTGTYRYVPVRARNKTWTFLIHWHPTASATAYSSYARGMKGLGLISKNAKFR